VTRPASEKEPRKVPLEDSFLLGDAQFRAMIENFPDPVALVDRRGVIRVWNANAQGLTGYPAKEIVGRSFVEAPFLRPSDMPRFLKIFAASLKKAPRNPIEVPVVHRDGALKRTEVRIGFIRDRRRIIGFQIVAADLTQRDWFEEALRQSEARLKSIFQAAPIGIGLLINRHFQMVNETVTGLVGYREEELLGQSARMLYPDEAEFERVGRMKYARIAESSVGTVETVWKRKDHTLIDILLSSCAVEPPDLSKGVIFTALDITERKRAETALQNRVEFERLILDLSNRFINLASEKIDEGIDTALAQIGQFVGVDRSYVFLFRAEGRRMDNTHEWCAENIEPQKERLQGLNVPDFPDVVRLRREGGIIHIPRTADLPAETEERREFEREGIRSLLAVPLSGEGTVTGFLGLDAVREEQAWTAETISLLKIVGEIFAGAMERRRAQEALRESEEKFRTLIEHSLVGNYIQQDFLIRFCNRTFAEIFGYNDPPELVGLHIRELITPESWPIVAGEVALRTSGEKEFSRYEFTGRKRDGSEVICEVLGARILFKGRAAIQGSIIDITERKRAEEKIRGSLREKEVLLREIYHRTKNNMQVISSLLNLQARKLTDAKAVDMFRDTQQRIRTMALVHERLYRSQDLSRVDFGVYLHRLTTHLFHFHQTQPEQVRLVMETSEVPLDIQTAIPCGLIANEIVSNALKHAFPEGRKGTIFIRLDRDDKGLIVLSIRDDGIGLPAGLDIRRSDTLGMEIVTSLVGQIDGRLEIFRDKGTEFRISFREIPYAPRIPG
jgi:PAS domain S-box-containing protein